MTLTTLCQVLNTQLVQDMWDITPIFKKDDKPDKINYRTTSILPNLNKTYERFMQNQMYSYLKQIFSKYQ